MKLGIDRFRSDAASVLKERNIALVSGSSCVDSSGVPTYKIVKAIAPGYFKAIWSLQHGFFVDKQDNMVFSDSFYWQDLEVEIKSLYGNELLPQPDWLKGIDAIMVDLIDVGTRVYTFVNHIVLIMKYLSGKNIDLIILDRPNPLNGLIVEGNVMEQNYFSIVGQLPVPMRHALTLGEFISFALTYNNIDLKLEIVKIQGWDRNNFFKGIWTYPSPNMSSFNTAILYPGSVMLEGTNLSEGRGTTRPFEFVGAPYIDNLKLVNQLIKLNLKGVKFIPVFFKPEFSKFSGEICKGIFVYTQGISDIRSFEVFYEIIRTVRYYYPDQFKWQEPPYEFEYTRLPIDMICGSDIIRKSIEKNIHFKEIEPGINRKVQGYINDIDRYLLY